MTTTTQGFDGSVLEGDMAQILDGVSSLATVDSPAAWQVTAVANFRRISIAPGIGTDAFVRVATDAAVTLDLPAPAATGGQWHLIVGRRSWADNSFVFASIPHTVSSSLTPPADANDDARDFLIPPPSRPSAYKRQAGVQKDQELYWAYVNTANNTVVLFDLRRDKRSGALYGINAHYIAGRDLADATVTPGQNKVLASFTVALSEAKKVEVHVEGQWFARDITAGKLWIQVGGAPITAKLTQNNHSGVTTPVTFHLIGRVTLPAGTSTITLNGSNDSGSGGNRSVEYTHASVLEV